MIGIDRNTGRTLTDWEQFVSRVTQVMTTPVGSREHRRDFGSRVPETLGRNMGDSLLVTAQAYAIDAFYSAINGLGDFTPSRVVATRTATGLSLAIYGKWRNQSVSFEVAV